MDRSDASWDLSTSHAEGSHATCTVWAQPLKGWETRQIVYGLQSEFSHNIHLHRHLTVLKVYGTSRNLWCWGIMDFKVYFFGNWSFKFPINTGLVLTFYFDVIYFLWGGRSEFKSSCYAGNSGALVFILKNVMLGQPVSAYLELKYVTTNG
jgi:hypothetical protein